MGQALSGDRANLAPGLGARGTGLRFCARHPQDDQHHQRGRGANRSLRKIIKTRGSFPNDDAALKLLYLAIRNAGMRWRRSTERTAAMGKFAIQFGARFPGSVR
jgi:transposase-like protein